MNILGVVPARAGSRRIPNKNMRLLGGKPLLEYSVAALRESGVCSHILIATDTLDVTAIADRYNAGIFRRVIAGDDQPDIVWVRELVNSFAFALPDALIIARPTSPFRGGETITHAWERFQADQPADSLRAVREVREHPGKMWRRQRDRIEPLLSGWITGVEPSHYTPWHSAPTQILPAVFVQTGGLEIVWTKTIRETETLAGSNIIGFELNGDEALDINTEEDWESAERALMFNVV